MVDLGTGLKLKDRRSVIYTAKLNTHNIDIIHLHQGLDY